MAKRAPDPHRGAGDAQNKAKNYQQFHVSILNQFGGPPAPVKSKMSPLPKQRGHLFSSYPYPEAGSSPKTQQVRKLLDDLGDTA